jgi:hypothetical protein
MKKKAVLIISLVQEFFLPHLLNKMKSFGIKNPPLYGQKLYLWAMGD